MTSTLVHCRRLAAATAVLIGATAMADVSTTARLQVSANHRFLVDGDGKPFFWLGDTAWELFHRLTREEADHYLTTRAKQGYTVIQAVILAEFDGLNTPNAYGEKPLRDNDPGQPNEAYFTHVDWVLDRAAELGLRVGLLPTWGDKWNLKWGKGPVIFTPANAGVYGEFVGRRYRGKPIVWIMGGDRPVESDEHLRILREMAEGIRRGDGGEHLMTLHPSGRSSSAKYVHDEPWLDFNMLQSGHADRHFPSYDMVARDYAREPVKPCLDGEPCYEDHPVMGKGPREPYHDDLAVRRAAYWGLFAGGFGHTYGCHPVWQMWDASRPAANGARTPWRQALLLPGARQMQHAKSLLLSRPFLTRIPDQSLLAEDAGEGAAHRQATRGEDGGYALVYTPSPAPFRIRTEALSGERLTVWWYDPRTGAATDAGTLPKRPVMAFTPPQNGPDWVLVLDDAARGFPPPGAATAPSKEALP